MIFGVFDQIAMRPRVLDRVHDLGPLELQPLDLFGQGAVALGQHRAESRQGDLAVFGACEERVIVLPEQPGAQAPEVTITAPWQPEPWLPERARILLVDDEPSVLALLIATLADDDYEVQTATDGQTALDAARECVLAVGVRRTTVTDVARRAGVSRMTLYRRYPDLEAVLAALMTREFGRLIGQAAEPARAGMTKRVQWR